MAQSVVYADLKFAAGLPLPAPACPAAPDEDDSPYENVTPGPVPAAPGPGSVPCPPARAIPPPRPSSPSLSPDWQVTRRLQDTSRAHAAEQGRLSQEVSVREQSLEQTRLELARARAELQRAWREGNSSRLELGTLSAELERVGSLLGKAEKEVQEVQGKLNNSENTVAVLRACVNTDCCPQGWVLYRSKCLFISVEKKTWWESQYDCRRKSAQLLVQGNWPSWTVP
ncbi:CD72 protein, partial [Nyctibius grandis]|nr:CD72 protein [Nyctibius grandis]